jgi:hypothetical protein
LKQHARPSLREQIASRIREVKARIGAALLRRAARKQRNLGDRLCARVLAWVTNSANTQPDHFMRDEIIDADIEFDPKDLDRYQQQSQADTH